MRVEIVLSIIEFIGVISFALSGTIIAIRKRTDFIGGLIFALLTCFGGGFIRDIVLGITPRILTSSEYTYMALVAIAISLICFHLSFVGKIGEFINKHKHDFIIEFTDAIGLSVFCVFGIDVAVEITGGANPILLIFCGCITGVGGGMLRDICSAEIPFILRKHIYLIPTLIGAVLYTFTYNKMPQVASILISIGVIITLRVLAIIFKWNLPKPKAEITE